MSKSMVIIMIYMVRIYTNLLSSHIIYLYDFDLLPFAINIVLAQPDATALHIPSK